MGSAESRAAARALLESRERGVRRMTIVLDPAMRPRCEGPPDEVSVGPWSVGTTGTLFRVAFIPKGMDEGTELSRCSPR